MSNYARMMLGKKRSLVAILVSLAILAVLALKVDFRLDRVLGQLRLVNWPILLAAFAYSAAWHIFVGADKWWRILRSLGADIPYSEVLRVRLGSDPIRFVSPFKLGEVVNAVYFSRLKELGFSRAAGSIAFDKALNFFGTLFWLYIGLVALADVPEAGLLILHTVVGAGIVLMISVRPCRRQLSTVHAIVFVTTGVTGGSGIQGVMCRRPSVSAPTS